jgi:hypothetical protein
LAAAAGIAFGSVAVAVDAGPDFAGQNDIEYYPKTRKIAAAAAVAAVVVAIEAVGEIVVKLKLVVDAVSGLRSTILFVIAELEQLVAAEAADIVVAVAVAAVVVVVAVVAAAAVQLAADTAARYLQYWIQCWS